MMIFEKSGRMTYSGDMNDRLAIFERYIYTDGYQVDTETGEMILLSIPEATQSLEGLFSTAVIKKATKKKTTTTKTTKTTKTKNNTITLF